MNPRDVEQAAARQGWVVERRKAGHMAYTCPTCFRTLFASYSPSDGRAMRNFVSQLRAHGFVWRGRGGKHR